MVNYNFVLLAIVPVANNNIALIGLIAETWEGVDSAKKMSTERGNRHGVAVALEKLH